MRGLHMYEVRHESVNSSRAESRFMSNWYTLQQELREIVWLASVVAGLSLLGVGLAVAVAGLA